MQTTPRSRVRALVAAAVVALGAAACGDSASTTASGVTVAAAAPIEVSYLGGKVSGTTSPTAAKNAGVTITVTADVADEVHLHGYDLKADVAPGKPATFTFKATKTGIFEVELEKKGLKLFELTVK